jgi:hypothetical protein
MVMFLSLPERAGQIKLGFGGNMATDDEAARRARAEGLRQKIAGIKSDQKTQPEVSEDDSETSGTQSEQKPGDETARPAETPREFVHRRMRELDRDKAESNASDD